MKITVLSHSDKSGGAARASYRLVEALSSPKLASVDLIVNEFSDDKFFLKPELRLTVRVYNLLKAKVSDVISRRLTRRNSINSMNVFPSKNLEKINDSTSDIVNIHWINRETISINEIANINKPLIMTLHDMWAFCGTEHYSNDTRYVDGYDVSNIDGEEIGKFLDIDKFCWMQKKKYWRDFIVVTPSSWLTECAKKSKLFKGWDIRTIPNTLNQDVFKPISKEFCRKALNLPLDKNIVGFGAIGGGSDPRKGFELLLDGINHLQSECECLIFGQSEPMEKTKLNKKTYYMGHVSDDVTLALIYNAIDVMVVPSTLEAFGQTGSEAQACGTPVVAFSNTGLKDIVEHGKTGFLVDELNGCSLKSGIETALSSCYDYKYIASRAHSLWSYDSVSKQYLELYSEVLGL